MANLRTVAPKSPNEELLASQASMMLAVLFIEVKARADLDFFRDPEEGADRDSWQFVLNTSKLSIQDQGLVKKDFGQHVAYATEICARQHRHCCYSISLSWPLARLIRWDRAGAVVSCAFDLRKHPSILCQFLWCFSFIGNAGRGYDLTVKPAQYAQELVFRHVIERHLAAQLPGYATLGENARSAALKEHFRPGHVSIVDFPCVARGEDAIMQLLISRPISYPQSPTGRATRGYWAVDLQTHAVHFLKDTWRYERRSTHIVDMREGHIINFLRHTKHVTNIPRVVGHSDVIQVAIKMHLLPDQTVAALRQELREC